MTKEKIAQLAACRLKGHWISRYNNNSPFCITCLLDRCVIPKFAPSEFTSDKFPTTIHNIVHPNCKCAIKNEI